MVSLSYTNGSSGIDTRRALWKIYGGTGRIIYLKTVQWQVTKFDRDFTLRKEATGEVQKR